MVGTRRRVLTLLGALAVIVTAAVLPITAGTAYAAEATAKFDWAMPARTGLDQDHDGVIDVRVTRAQIARPEPGWQVNFDACASTPSTGATIVRYTWLIDHVPVGEGSPCGGFTYYFPEEGVYEVKLEILDSAGNEAHVIRDITVQDFLVIALGDSFGSGQGNPDVPISGNLFSDAENALALLNQRLVELGSIKIDYDATVSRIRTARSRLNDLNLAIAHGAEVCNPFGPSFDPAACLAAPGEVDTATKNLLAALTLLGNAGLMDTLDLIEGVLDALEATWDASVSAARALVTDAQEAFDASKREAAPVWQNKRCNRSSIAGQAQAALALEEADPHTSVTLVHLACSGAEVRTGLIGPYAGVEPPPRASDLPPQVDKAAALIGGREVDAVLLSIGGNDAGFGKIVEACIFQDGCHQWEARLQDGIAEQIWQICEVTSFLDADCFEHYADLISNYSGSVLPDSAAEIFADRAADIPAAYGDLALALAGAFPAVAADPGRVYISEYPNALEDDNGTICTSAEDGPFDMLPGITFDEGYWLRETTRQINGLVADAAQLHGWTPVGGIFAGFAGHGYCADYGRFRRLQDSFRMQGTMNGVVHPTAAGHAVYRKEYRAELSSDLYVRDKGDLTGFTFVPRAPNPDYSSGGGWVPPPAIARFEWTIDPDGTAHFDGCGSTGYMGVPIDQYLWPIPWVFRNGQWVSTNESGEPWVSSSCDDFTYPFTEAGEYRVVLDIKDALGNRNYVDHYLHVSDAAPPSVVGVPGRAPDAGGWYSGNVTVDWQATDPAPSSGVPTDPPDTVASTAGSVVYTSAPSCDPAGNCAAGTLKISIDKASPSVIGVPDRKPNAAGWYSGNVTIDWHATDPAPSSGATTDPLNTLASSEGTYIGYTSAPSCDPVGHCATGAVKLSIDKTAPTAKADASPAPNAHGWNNTNVTVSFSGTDSLSGIDACDPAVVLGSEGAGQSASGTCKDKAGNTSAPATASGISIDKTAPITTCQSPVPTFLLGEAGATVSAAVSDGLSGPAAATVSEAADTTSVGAKTVSLTGRDVAGNEGTASCSYVVAYVFGGFRSPVDGGGVLNVVKAGRAIPLKWRLTDASGTPVTGLTTATVTVLSFDCSLGTSTDLIEEETAGESGLQNLGDGYYQLNWKAPSSYAESCKTMRLDLGEGLVHTALFKFTK